jgi:hypothetical protein
VQVQSSRTVGDIMYIWWVRSCLAAFVLAMALPVHAADVVGRATALRPMATQALPQNRPVPIGFNAPIFQFGALQTAPNGALQVTFLDNSRLSMGPASFLVVDQYVYAGPGGASRQVVRYTKGAFRFVSGTMPKDRVQIDTPTTSIGIRGTTIRTLVTDDGTTTVGLDEGDAFVTSKQTGQTVFLSPGEKVTIKPSGEIGVIELGKVEGCP